MARTAEKTTRVILMGSGAPKSEKILRSTLRDFMADKTNATFYVPMTKELWNDNLASAVDVLIEDEVPYDIFIAKDETRTRAFKPFIQNAQNVIERERGLLVGLVRKVQEADNSFFLALMDDDDAALDTAMLKAMDAGIPVLDLTAGLTELESSGEKDEDEADDDEEEAPKARQRRSSKPQAAEAEEPEEDDEEDEEVQGFSMDSESIAELADKVAKILASRMVNA